MKRTRIGSATMLAGIGLALSGCATTQNGPQATAPNEKRMELGAFSVSLAVKDLDFGAGTVGEQQIFEVNIADGWEGVDIGPKSIELFKAEVAAAKTVLWNGPMGIFEIDACNQGTFAVAKTIAESEGISIIGGGDSVKAINMSGYSNKVTFMSTGGGASLEFLEGKELPGVAALDQA